MKVKEVIWTEYDPKKNRQELAGKGIFVAWGVQGEYSDCASLVYSSMIIMSEDKKLHNVPVECVEVLSYES